MRRHVPVTPTYAWPLLAAELGTEVWVKHENHTPTGAFKMRGGLVLFDRLRRERPDLAGVVSATRGNHGQRLAFAGRLHGLPVTIVVPHGNSAEKNAAMVALGAELVVHGDDYQAAREHAEALADRARPADGRAVRARPRARRGDVRPRAVRRPCPTSTSSTCRSGWARASAA